MVVAVEPRRRLFEPSSSSSSGGGLPSERDLRLVPELTDVLRLLWLEESVPLPWV